MKNTTIKAEFGKLLYRNRKAKSLSREIVADELGISTRTLANWEKGKTFIEDLSIIDDMDKNYDINIPTLLQQAITNIRSRQRRS